MWVGAEVPKPGEFAAVLTPVQEAVGSRGRMPGMFVPGMFVLGMLVPGMLTPVPPSQDGRTWEAAFPLRAGRQELGRNGLCSHRVLREEELPSLSL